MGPSSGSSFVHFILTFTGTFQLVFMAGSLEVGGLVLFLFLNKNTSSCSAQDRQLTVIWV